MYVLPQIPPVLHDPVILVGEPGVPLAGVSACQVVAAKACIVEVGLPVTNAEVELQQPQQQ
jgi:hypothetical protein